MNPPALKQVAQAKVHFREIVVLLLLEVLSVAVVGSGCSSLNTQSRVKIKEELGLFDALIPVPPDSVIALYERFDPQTFHTTYKNDLTFAQHLIDSMNVSLDAASRIDTLAIDHAIENFGNAARSKKTIFLSSSYFFLFNNPAIIRSVLTHEFGHIYFDKLSREQRDTLEQIWQNLRVHALFYIFRDGEYSGNARFGGHPDESPTELFASAFNLFSNKPDELTTRLQYVGPEHYQLIERLRKLLVQATHSPLRTSF